MAYERVQKTLGQSSSKKKHTPIVPPLIEQQTPADSQLSPLVKPSRIPSKEEREAIKRKIFDSISRSGENQAMREGLFSPTVREQKTPDFASTIGMPIQPKLTIGAPGDKYEQEADWMANQVMRMVVPDKPNTPTVQPVQDSLQRKCAACEQEEDKVQTKLSIQSATDVGLQAGDNIESRLNSSKGRGSPLPDEVRSFMEPRFGADFSQVRVHTGSEAVQMNRELNAQAFTHKQDVYFGAGKAPARDKLTAHELTHVVQQTEQLRGKANQIQHNNVSPEKVLTDHQYEQKTDRLAGQVISMAPTAIHNVQHQTDKERHAEIQRSPNGVPQDISRQLCHPTNRWPGNIEHSLIEDDYVTNINPGGGALEYAIPKSGPNGGTGYADMVDLVGHKVYEIKTYPGASRGVIEAARYVEKAQEHCAPPIPQSPWSVGNDYPAHTIPINSNEELVVRQYPQFPGVVVYYQRRRQVPEPFPVPVPEPGRQTDEDQRRSNSPQQQPVLIPQSAMQQIREFLRQVVESGQNAEDAAQKFLQQHPELVYVIAGAAIVIFLATIAEDILTLGAGIADDPATIAAAAALWRTAMQQLQAAQ